jgi:predicted site-specific integrase-resolvase
MKAKEVMELLRISRSALNRLVLYARVTTNKQKGDLENQLELLKQFCLNNGWTIDGI